MCLHQQKLHIINDIYTYHEHHHATRNSQEIIMPINASL